MPRLTIRDFLTAYQVTQTLLAGVAYTYYIAPDGNDSTGDGSLALPWASLSKALGQMSNGESVGLQTGTYAAEISKTSALNAITIAAMPAATPILICEGPHATWTKTDGQDYVYQRAVPGATFSVHEDTQRLTLKGSIADVDANEGSWYYAAEVCYVHVTGGGDPDTADTMYLTLSAGVMWTFSGDDVTITGVSFHHGFRAIVLSGDWPTLTDCAFYYWEGRYSGFETMSVAGANATIDTCAFHDLDHANAGEAIEVETTASSCTITGCTIDDTKYAVTILGGNNHTVTSCTIHTTRGYAIAAFGGTGHVISYNTIYQVDHGITINGAATTATLHHNLVYTTGAGAFEAGTRYAYVGESGATVLFYHCLAANGQLGTRTGVGWYIQSEGTTVTIKNCASYNNDQAYAQGAGEPTITADYNGSYSDTTPYGGGFPEGEHDLATDPTYTDPANHDYILLTGSPYVDAGIALEGINDNFLGDAPDIGYNELE